MENRILISLENQILGSYKPIYEIKNYKEMWILIYFILNKINICNYKFRKEHDSYLKNILKYKVIQLNLQN